MAERFRVALDATQMPAQGAGTATYILNLLEHVHALENRDFDFVVIAKDTDEARIRERAPDVPFIPVRLPTRPIRLAWEQIVLPRLLLRHGVDVLHSPHYTVPLGARVRRVVTVHDLTYLLMPELPSRSRRWFFRWMIPRAARRADGVIAISQHTLDDLRRRFPDIDASRCSVIPHGVEALYFGPVSPEVARSVARRYRLPDKYILHVGTIEPRKNVSAAVEAVRIVAEQDEAWHLVLVGPQGWETDEVYRLLRRSAHCRVLGYVDREHLPAIYAGAGALIVPSHYEGFGLPVLEAMAAGTPVITSGKGALWEVGGEAAIVVPENRAEAYGSILLEVLGSASRRSALADRGRTWASRFTWARAAQSTADVYRRVANERPSTTVG